MKRMLKFKTLILTIFIFSFSISKINCDNCYPRSIFIPRQLSYNPILENTLTLNAKKTANSNFIFSAKPIYTQNIGSKFQKYFNIRNNGNSISVVQENNYGTINPLWFDVISSNTTFYSSNLSFCPKRQTYGSMIYFAANLSHGFGLTINTAILGAKNDMHICEKNIQNLGTTNYKTVTQSFAGAHRCFGKICGKQTKTGLDDIQIKLIYSHCRNCSSCKNTKKCPQKDTKECYNENPEKHRFTGDIYGLLGIPTGHGSKAIYLFEPLIGSKHAQLGFGTNLHWNIKDYNFGSWSLFGEAKYRYAFSAQECRSFDLTKNCQWSRYMSFVNQNDKYNPYPAINNLTLKADVTPGSSIDLYLATRANYNAWNFELGYDFWYRTCEKIKICCKNFPAIGIADLKGIALQNPQSSSTANISQGVKSGTNQMVSDTIFVPVTLSDINCISGAQQSALSNSFYGSLGYKFKTKCDNSVLLGVNCSYELGSCNTPDNVTTWLNCNIYF